MLNCAMPRQTVAYDGDLLHSGARALEEGKGEAAGHVHAPPSLKTTAMLLTTVPNILNQYGKSQCLLTTNYDVLL
jgi:hypothetical protein